MRTTHAWPIQVHSTMITITQTIRHYGQCQRHPIKAPEQVPYQMNEVSWRSLTFCQCLCHQTFRSNRRAILTLRHWCNLEGFRNVIPLQCSFNIWWCRYSCFPLRFLRFSPRLPLDNRCISWRQMFVTVQSIGWDDVVWIVSGGYCEFVDSSSQVNGEHHLQLMRHSYKLDDIGRSFFVTLQHSNFIYYRM